MSEEQRRALPARFEAVGEALASGSASAAACAVAGHDLAHDGVSLEEALDGLRTTARTVLRAEPAFGDVRSLATAWSEAALTYLNRLSCEDPLTGLATLAHVRTRLASLYRAADDRPPRTTHALVVVDLLAGGRGGPADVLTLALRAARLGERARTVFPGHETIGRIGPVRVVVVADRDERLARRADLLRRLLEGVERDGGLRVWVEGLPGTDASAGLLLDELARL
nr:hypothetical protein [Nocardioides luti]